MTECYRAVRELGTGTNPLTLDDAKQRLKLNLEAADADIDAEVSRALAAGWRTTQQDSNLSIAVGRQLQQTQHHWDHPLWLYYPPTISITSIQYWDSSKTLQTLDPASYELVPFGFARSHVELDESPTLYDRLDAIRITYTAGFATAGDVPADLQEAILNRMESYFENDLDTSERMDLNRIYTDIIGSYRHG